RGHLLNQFEMCHVLVLSSLSREWGVGIGDSEKLRFHHHFAHHRRSYEFRAVPLSPSAFASPARSSLLLPRSCRLPLPFRIPNPASPFPFRGEFVRTRPGTRY